jgi:serine/threonine protein phosphatase PrpC
MPPSTPTSESTAALRTLRYAVGTDVGRRREENQDSYGCFENDNLRFYIVADGMGGAKGGATASSQAVKIVRDQLAGEHELTGDVIAEAVRYANAVIYEQGSNDEALTGMGTTFVGLAFVGTQLFVSNVGDSRAYRVRGGVIQQLTNDHTLVKELLRSGAITPEQADNHPVAHMLTRSLGPTPEVQVDCMVLGDGPARGDLYLMCSDGLYNLVTDDEIATILQNFSLDDAVQKLIDLANERGGTDNITVCIVEVGEEYPVGVEDLIEIPVADLYAPPTDSSRPSSSMSQEPLRQASAQAAAAAAGRIAAGSRAETQSSWTRAQARMPHTDVRAQENLAAPTSAVNSAALWINRRILTTTGRVGLLIGLGIAIGVLYPRYFGNSVPDLALSNGTVNPLAAVVARYTLDDTEIRSSVHRARLIQPTLNDLLKRSAESVEVGEVKTAAEGARTESSDNDSGSMSLPGSHITSNQVESIRHRQTVLKGALDDIDHKLALLEHPLTGDMAVRLKNIELLTERLRADLTGSTEDLETATRKLAVFIGRRQRLQVSDSVDLASEVSISSESVREKKEEFERATWAYLKEVEVWRFDPSNQSLTKSVSRLGRIREQRRRELSAEVQRAIEDNIAHAEQEIAQLTGKRDGIQTKLYTLEKDRVFFKAIIAGDARLLREKKTELEHDREVTASELEEVERMLNP